MTKTLPQLFVSRLQTMYDESDYKVILTSFSQKRMGSFRINTLKSSLAEIEQEFSEKGIIFRNFLHFSNIFVFDRAFEYAIKGTRAFYDGKIYLQSIASMLPVLVLCPQK